MPEKIRIKSYSKFFRYEKRIYSLGNFILPVPIVMIDAGYFLLGILTMEVLITIAPILKEIPWILKFIGVPMAFMKFFRTAKLDGKNPLFYLVDMLRYWLFEQGQYIENFKIYPQKVKYETVRWKVLRSKRGDHNV